MIPTKFRFICKEVSEQKIFKNRPMRKKTCLCRPCLLTDRDKMSNLYRGPSIYASYQVSDHLAKRFQRRFKKIGQSETRIACGTMFVNGSGQTQDYLQRTFHRCYLPNFSSFEKVVSEEKIFQKSTIQKQEWSVVAMFVNGSELNEQSLQMTF